MSKKNITFESFALFVVMILFALCSATYIVQVDLPDLGKPNWKMAGIHFVLFIIFVGIIAYMIKKFNFKKLTSYEGKYK